MMHWDGLVLTDSGGFQIFSLPDSRELTERGALFRSFHDNSRQLLSPESSIAMQQDIGSDIMMVLDVCIPSTTEEAGTREAMERTHRWAVRSLAARDAVPTGQALSGRKAESFRRRAKSPPGFCASLPLKALRSGVWRSAKARRPATRCASCPPPCFLADKPRYLMGVGTPSDLLDCVRRGIGYVRLHFAHQDDPAGLCAGLPGRRDHCAVFRLDDSSPLDSSCPCFARSRYSTRGYLHHLLWQALARGPTAGNPQRHALSNADEPHATGNSRR
ncbi:MAG: tRNA guanosine(34) transglycosylase Tgt [Polyangia bacterium]